MSPEKKFELGDYVEVKDRIAILYELYPNARLVTDSVTLTSEPDGVPRVLVKALAYRHEDDPHPGVGHSWMVLPGSTPYTRGSEVENAETSSWGRAIASLGILIDRSIASAQEVANKDSGAGAVVPPAAPVTQPYVAPEEVLLGDASRTGKMVAGTTPCDLQFREDPEGHSIGFTLRIAKDKNIPQVIIKGAIGEAIFQWSGGDPAMLKNKSATVSGRLFELRKDGRADSYRMYVTKIRTEEFELPADVPAEAPSEPLFPPLDEDERAAVAGSLG